LNVSKLFFRRIDGLPEFDSILPMCRKVSRRKGLIVAAAPHLATPPGFGKDMPKKSGSRKAKRGL
jgi:hypothetical protein